MKKITEASQFQALQDVLRGNCNMNLSIKSVGVGQNSLIHPALSDAGAIALNGDLIQVAASSSVFALQTTTVPAYGGCAFILCVNAASGSGVGYATNALTSTQMSKASSVTGGAAASNLLASEDLVWPEIPVTTVPVGIYIVTGNDSAHVAGSSTFSSASSDNATHTFKNILNLNKNS